jgi:DNA polymerase I-like protein with 3'-5' exonuclease and polymerase domains
MKKPHRGGEQLPLLTPSTDWSPPTELPDLLGRGVTHWALDTETCDHRLGRNQGPGWPYRDGYVCGVSAAWREDAEVRSLYVPLRHPDTACTDTGRIQNWLQHHLRGGLVSVFQNCHYDVGWLRILGIQPGDYRGSIEDTQCQAFMLEENHLKYDLDSICERLGLSGKDETLLREALTAHSWPSVGREAKRYIHKLPARFVGPYAAADAAQTLEAWERMTPMLAEQRIDGAYRTEMDLVPCVHRMQHDGVRVNVARAEQWAAKLYAGRDETLAELGRKLGESITLDNITRGDWLEKRFDAEGIKYPRTAPTGRFPEGQPSFTAGTLGWMHKHPHWLPQLVVRAEKQHKAAKDFLEGFIVKPAHNGRVHANINQFKGEDGNGTRTHRFSYSDPPLQQMPAHNEDIADAVRGCFEAEEGEQWCCADYCYDEKTEILTEDGWQLFANLQGEKVAQWHEGIVSFVEPISVFVGDLRERTMVHVSSPRQIDFCVTENHRCLLLDRDGVRQHEMLARDFPDRWYSRLLPQCGLVLGGDDSTDPDVIRLIVALQADAADRPLKYNNRDWVFYLRKERKIQRLLDILQSLKLPHQVRLKYKGEQTYIGVPEQPVFREFLSPGKTFNVKALLGLSPRLRRVFLEELPKWDGTENMYGSTNTACVDAVQAVAACTNSRAGMNTSTTRSGKLFSLLTLSTKRGTWITDKTTIAREKMLCRVYCVIVPSGWVVTRRCGRVTIGSNSQQEYRLIVHFAEVLGLPRASVAGDRYRASPDTDYHRMVAEMTDLDRQAAKAVNFAKAFGAGAAKFAVMINKTVEEATAILEQYDRELPFVSLLAKTAQEAADRRGYVRLIDDARLHYGQWEPAWRSWPEEQAYVRGGGKLGVAPCGEEEAKLRAGTEGHPWHRKRLRRAFTRKAGNGLIQGSAARMTKIAMVQAHREGIKLRLQVHDELNASVGTRKEGERLAEIMTHAVKLTVPIVVKAEYGRSWGDVE